MGCPASCDIEDNLVFSICTHDPDTGVLTDADSLPIYRVYEDETATPILTGSMAKLDDPNTTGFYTELIVCTAANGFEDGKTYTIYIEATVDADTGGISYGFKAVEVPEKSASAIAFTYTVTSSVDGTPIEGAQVWISIDIAGTNIIWNGDTDTFGVARDDDSGLPYLDPGTYYFWTQKAGFTFANPDTEVVS
jgi:hypothetical protein